MSLRRVLLLALTLFLPATLARADVKTLRDQLALATEDKHTLARIELLRRILDVEPGDAVSHRLLVELWLGIQDYDLAEATLKGWPAAPADLSALIRAAVLRYRDEDVPGAIRVLQEYLAESPRDAAAHKALVDALLTTKDSAALLAALDAYIAIQPDATNLIRRANAKLALGDYPGAIADARAAEALDPEASIVKNNLPNFEKLEITLKTLPPLDAALEKNPRDLVRLMQRAWWLRYGGLHARSLADADAALAVDPQSLAGLVTRERARWLLAQVKSDNARRDTLVDVTHAHPLDSIEAIAAADITLQKNPRASSARRQRARALNGAGQYLLAQRDAAAALGLDEKDAAAALELLYATSLLGQDIAPVFRRIEKMAPPKPQLALANAHLADLYFRQSNLPLALDYANRSLALGETESVLRVKAAALQRLGRPDEANAATKRANALHP